MKTIKDLKNELKIFNYELNGFIYTFEVAYLKKQNFIKKRYADSDEIDDFFYEEILKLKPMISEYVRDYRKWKSIDYISKKINRDVETIIKYLKGNSLNLDIGNISNNSVIENYHYMNYIKNFYDNTLTSDTEIKMISSYGILKNLQKQDRIFILKEKSN